VKFLDLIPFNFKIFPLTVVDAPSAVVVSSSATST